MELGSHVNTGTAMNRSNGLLQLPLFSYVLICHYSSFSCCIHIVYRLLWSTGTICVLNSFLIMSESTICKCY